MSTSNSQPVRLITLNNTDKRVLEAILHLQFAAEAVVIDIGMTQSGVISIAEFSLLEHPERLIAVVLNTETEDPTGIYAIRNPAIRMLTSCSVEGWHLALAIPRLDAWAKCDPRIEESLERDPPKSYFDASKRIEALTSEQPFDATILRQRSVEYRGLEDFLRRATNGTLIPARAPWF